ncbi:hypothetical protein J1N35_028344 [Gossypium stocksii]|uniref:RNase H type-1 domain-containing protein n=1 Tax=Gossypium stocksii TaxID=47602 RepID=A0A9D3UW42_9ROSI|nr:hypothetical protein J1N35_028344 [Gossypium stocksii]
MDVWQEVLDNVYWEIGDGQLANFYNDVWLRHVRPIVAFCKGLEQLLTNGEGGRLHMVNDSHCLRSGHTVDHNCAHEIVKSSVVGEMSFVSGNTNPLHTSRNVTGRCWLPPYKGWITLNTDGAGSSNVFNACIGGVFRDSDAN